MAPHYIMVSGLWLWLDFIIDGVVRDYVLLSIMLGFRVSVRVRGRYEVLRFLFEITYTYDWCPLRLYIGLTVAKGQRF